MRLLVLVVAALVSAAALAQPYPGKPVKVLVPFSPGGTSDIVARLIAAKLSEEFGQQFVVENRGGAGGTIATAIVAKAPPDGYLVLAGHQGVAFNATLYTKLSYDTAKELLLERPQRKQPFASEAALLAHLTERKKPKRLLVVILSKRHEWSDPKQTLEGFWQACKKTGFERVVIQLAHSSMRPILHE